jgi:phosphatidylinositol alpha-mannosyltransferase
VATHPGLDGDDLVGAYQQADLFVLASRFEVFSLVLLEAMAKHVPVVTTDVPHNNMGSLLVNHVDAVLLPNPQDVEGMAKALSHIWLDTDLRGTLASNGFLFAQKYSWDAAKAKYDEVYSRVMQR